LLRKRFIRQQPCADVLLRAGSCQEAAYFFADASLTDGCFAAVAATASTLATVPARQASQDTIVRVTTPHSQAISPQVLQLPT